MTWADWNLIIQAHLSLIWCQWAMDPQNHTKTIGQMRRTFNNEYENIEPLNIGTFLMASYPLFVFPQQADFESIDFSKIDTSKFRVLHGTKSNNKKRFCSRIRNALSHGKVEVKGDNMIFMDRRKDGSDQFRAEIVIGDYGKFIGDFMHEVKSQFQRR